MHDLWEKNYRNILAMQVDDKRIDTIRPGQQVIVLDAGRKRLDWQRGVVLKIYPGKDGIVRVVDLLIAGGEHSYRRPANGLILFEAHPDADRFPRAEDVIVNDPETGTGTCPATGPETSPATGPAHAHLEEPPARLDQNIGRSPASHS